MDRSPTGHPPLDRSSAQLDVYEWALLHAGPPLAVRAAVAKLLRAGALTRTATGIAATGDAPPTHPLEAEVVALAGSNPRRATLMFRAARGAWVRRTVRGLVSEGYLVSRRTRRTALTRTVIPAVVLFGAGAVATDTGDSVTGLLLIIVGVIACVAVFRSGLGSVRATPVGVSALRERRRLEPRGRLETDPDPDSVIDPDGSEDPSLRVALFGMRDLERSDPALAAQVGIPFSDSASLAR